MKHWIDPVSMTPCELSARTSRPRQRRLQSADRERGEALAAELGHDVFATLDSELDFSTCLAGDAAAACEKAFMTAWFANFAVDPMNPETPKMIIPADIQELYQVGTREETVSFRRAHSRDGSHRLEYATNGPRDYYLWNVTQQHREQSWCTAREMWEHARAAADEVTRWG